MKHAVHSCWHCSANILADEPEERVQGLPGHAIRYAHATEEGCQKAISRHPWPETYGRDPMDDAERLWEGKLLFVTFAVRFFSRFSCLYPG